MKPVPFQIHKKPAVEGADPRSQAIFDSVDALLELLPLRPEDRAEILRQISEKSMPIPSAKAGEVMGTILKFLPRDKHWTIDDLRQKIAESGLEAVSKELYNSVSYLARKGLIQRVGYGRYIVNGAEIVTSDDYGGASVRHEDAYRTSRAGEE